MTSQHRRALTHMPLLTWRRAHCCTHCCTHTQLWSCGTLRCTVLYSLCFVSANQVHGTRYTVLYGAATVVRWCFITVRNTYRFCKMALLWWWGDSQKWLLLPQSGRNARLAFISYFTYSFVFVLNPFNLEGLKNPSDDNSRFLYSILRNYIYLKGHFAHLLCIYISPCAVHNSLPLYIRIHYLARGLASKKKTCFLKFLFFSRRNKNTYTLYFNCSAVLLHTTVTRISPFYASNFFYGTVSLSTKRAPKVLRIHIK